MRIPASAALPLILVVFAASLTAQGVAAQPDPPSYRVDWLGEYFYPHAMNDRGQVVGYDVRRRGEGPALLWNNGTVTDLGAGEAHDINNHGVIVLAVPVPLYGPPGVVLVTPEGVRTDLALPERWGSDFRHQYSINDAGQVAGKQRFPNSPDGRAFVWDRGVITYLNLGIPLGTSSAHAISNAGHVVGWYSDNISSSGGFIWKDGRATLIGGPAISVNDLGQVLFTTSGVWTDGTMATIPALPLRPGSIEETAVAEAAEINNFGQVAGWSQEAFLIDEESGWGSIQRAIVWDPVNGTRDLGALAGLGPDAFNQFPLARAIDLNNAGQIVGFGSRGGWILTPVPEPTGALCVVATVAVFTSRRTARRRNG